MVIVDEVWFYKNFNMVTELEIAGDFIYDGVHTLNQMKSLRQDAQLFSFLYHVSVGIERLQKIVVVLFEDFNLEMVKEFSNGLITHSHVALQKRINELTECKLSRRENEFLSIITNFYYNGRYSRFDFGSPDKMEQRLVEEFIYKYLEESKMERSVSDESLLVNDDVKELFGRVIGRIAKKYYDLIRQGCDKNDTFTYELRADSKSAKIFLNNDKKDSLQKNNIDERISFKELLVFLINSNHNTSLFRYIKSIKPLDFDPAMVNDYIFDICNGEIPQELIDEVEQQYIDCEYSKAREDEVDVIGNPHVLFDIMAADDCLRILKEFENGDCSHKDFAEVFPEMFEEIEFDVFGDDDDSYKIGGKDIGTICNEYLQGVISDAEFESVVNKFYVILKKNVVS